MSPWLKVTDLFAQVRHGRPPVLIGRVGPYKLIVVDRHDPGIGEPRATLFVARPSTARRLDEADRELARRTLAEVEAAQRNGDGDD